MIARGSCFPASLQTPRVDPGRVDGPQRSLPGRLGPSIFSPFRIIGWHRLPQRKGTVNDRYSEIKRLLLKLEMATNLAVRQRLLEFLDAIGRDVGKKHIQVLKLGQPFQVDKSSVGNLRISEQQ